MMDAAGGQLAIAPEPESSSPLIDLPSEVWGEMLKKIDQNDALNLRLVNKDFMEKVNNLYEDWKITLDESSPYLEMILDLRVKEVIVHPSFRPQGILFRYPDLIQKLTFTSCNGSTQNTQLLLQSKNLKFLHLNIYGSEPSVVGPLGYNYPDLHTLEIDLKISKEDQANLLRPGNLFHRLLMNSTMHKLNSFNYCNFSCYSYNLNMTYNCLSVLLSFLSRQGQNLKHLYYKSTLLQRFSFPGLDDSIVLKNMTSLDTLSFRFTCSFDPLAKTLRRLIQNQKKLVDLDFCYTFRISSTFLREIVANNFQTLTSVEINHWTFEEGQADGVFDASIFQACHSLTNLKVIAANPNPNVVNLFSLPAQIQTLCLSDFRVHSEDILNFLLAHSVLSELHIYSGGNLPVLEAILSHPYLCEINMGLSCHQIIQI